MHIDTSAMAPSASTRSSLSALQGKIKAMWTPSTAAPAPESSNSSSKLNTLSTLRDRIQNSPFAKMDTGSEGGGKINITA